MDAQLEARRLLHDFVSTEQILVGLLANKDSVPSEVLLKFGVTYTNVSRQTENIIGRGKRTSVAIPFTQSGKTVLELARNTAGQHRHSYIAPEHLLMRIIQEGEGVAYQIFNILDVNVAELRIALEHKFAAPSDDFEAVFNTARVAEFEVLKTKLAATRIKYERALASGKSQNAIRLFERIKALEWLMSWHETKA